MPSILENVELSRELQLDVISRKMSFMQNIQFSWEPNFCLLRLPTDNFVRIQYIQKRIHFYYTFPIEIRRFRFCQDSSRSIDIDNAEK